MSDSKISNLPAATTPLAGTEVLPIVQSSTTKKVAVSDLTAGRNVSAANLTATGTLDVTGAVTGASYAATNASGVFIGAELTTTDITGSARARIASTGSNFNDLISYSASHASRANQAWVGGDGSSVTTVVQAAGAEVARFTSTTGVGVLTTPSAWDTSTLIPVQVGYGAAFVGHVGADAAFVTSNAYRGVGGWKRINAGYASKLQIGDGEFYFEAAGTSTAGSDATFVSKMTIANSGIITMQAYGAGAATFSSGGVISSVSDETWKVKDGVPTNPEAMLQKLSPGYWYYNDEKKGIFGIDRQLGFYAQNVHAAIGPEAAPQPEVVTSKNADGVETTTTKPWGYYDRSVLAVTVMALQNALKRIDALEAKVAQLEAAP